MLISTNKSISEIGNDCNFPNTSHFIKLFKKEYGMTPASYRHRHAAGGESEPVLSAKAYSARDQQMSTASRM